MGLRIWGIGLLVLGILSMGAGVFGLFNARDMWQEAEATCAGAEDRMCGAGKTYVAALLMVVAPLATLGGALMLFAGGVLIAVGRWLDEKAAKAAEVVSTLVG